MSKQLKTIVKCKDCGQSDVVDSDKAPIWEAFHKCSESLEKRKKSRTKELLTFPPHFESEGSSGLGRKVTDR